MTWLRRLSPALSSSIGVFLKGRQQTIPPQGGGAGVTWDQLDLATWGNWALSWGS